MSYPLIRRRFETETETDNRYRYVTKSKERTVWQRKRDQLLTEQKQLEQETEEFLAKHDAELNGLLAEYSKIRHDAGKSGSDTGP